MIQETILIVSILIISIFIAKKISFSHRYFNYIWSVLGLIFEYQLHPFKKELFKQASGVVLDVGSGTGPTFKYLTNKNKVTKVIAIEPNRFMIKQLKKESSILNGIECEILSKTIEESIKDNDIQKNSIDTVICNLVLCSVPQPKEVLKDIQKLLKPGGRILFVEHVVATNIIGKYIEYAFSPIWSLLFDGCCITRDTGSSIKNMKGWSNVNIGSAKGPFFKYICGYAIKE